MMTAVRRDLPSGTVSFLFTDVEGSTRLLHELGADVYAEALAGHRRVLREAFSAHGGVEVDTQGDAFFVAFPTAPGALRAAAEALEGLAAGPIRVRMGIHTGTPHLAEEGYVGVDVHRAARIAACGHGGQVLISASTAALIGGDGLHDLGEHRLKDLSAPERIYQLGDCEFSPLKSLYRTNLPIPATPFLGRERELLEVMELLSREDVRLLTLTGPGGTGKTRLAAQAAGALAERYPHGVWWVPLAPLRDPELVLATAGQALGAKDGLAEHIADKAMLLLLDNFEQVVDAAADVAGLLGACPQLDLLVTSREPLHVTGEQEYPVPPLVHEEGVGFFLARARAVKPDFGADDTVSEICRRLDELPLALELAAARVKALSPAQILERLEQRLPLLTGGARDLPERQRTLRATIAWSYELLEPAEQRLFAALAVFSGGCTLEAAEEVTDADLDTLQSLVDKSLLRHTDERFWMLETIREYAAERLREDSAAEGWHRRHAEHFLVFAERIGPELGRAAGQADALELVEREFPNLRLALDWFTRAGASESGLRLAGALRAFWFKRGSLDEGRRRLGQLLEASDEPSSARAKALSVAALLAVQQGDWAETKRWGAEGRRLSLELGERRSASQSILPLARALLGLGDRAGAVALAEEAAALGREIGDEETIAMAAFSLGYAALEKGDLERARSEFETAAANTAAPHVVARSLAALGSVALRDDRRADALALLRDSLRTALEFGERGDTIAWALELLGAALVDSDPARGAALLGAAEALREELGMQLEGIELELHERAVAALASVLAEAARTEAWAAARGDSLEEIVQEALRQ
jgi:predicted ATPase/class 3 adenylate cyclase